MLYSAAALYHHGLTSRFVIRIVLVAQKFVVCAIMYRSAAACKIHILLKKKVITNQ